MNRISAVRSGNSVTVYMDGVNNVFTFDREEDAKEIFRTALETKANPTEDNLNAFRALMDPFYKIEATNLIERDRSGNLYLKGYNIAMPQLMKEKILEYIEEGFDMTPLINFWKLLMLNEDKVVIDSLYKFAQHFQFPITDMGYFIAYKSVNFAGKKVEPLAIKICNEFIRIKSIGKNPDNYSLICNNPDSEGVKGYQLMENVKLQEYLDQEEEDTAEAIPMRELFKMTDAERDAFYDEEMDGYYRQSIIYTRDVVKVEGILSNLFDSLGDMFKEVEGSFTDIHTGKMTIRLGEPARMNRADCDNDPNVTCSRGLHVGTPEYVSGFGGGNSYKIACLVNPMNVVAVPVDYNGQKMR
ncbi:MAG TPA: hypothetical protein DCL77_02050, partial [Prolixibacteraceae bacterium]|nr:hypothetical protein [Prolixibacteraceae bacterium]